MSCRESTAVEKIDTSVFSQQIQYEKCKITVFALVIIGGLGLLAVGAVGLGAYGDQVGWWKVAVLNPLDAVKFMAGGFSSGGVLIIVGSIGVDYASKRCIELNEKDQKAQKHIEKASSTSLSTQTSNYLFSYLFGREEWKTFFNYEVLGEVPVLELLTTFDLTKEIPILIPAISIEEFLTLLEQSAITLFQGALTKNQGGVLKDMLTSKTDKPYWVIWKKEGIENKTKGLDDRSRVRETGYEVSSVLEAMVAVCVEYFADLREDKDTVRYAGNAYLCNETKVENTALGMTHYGIAVELSSANGLDVRSTKRLSGMVINKTGAVRKIAVT